MGTAFRAPGKIVSVPMDPLVAINQPLGTGVVILTTGAADTVTLPSGTAPTTPVFGLLYEAGPAVVGGLVQVVINGIWSGIASGTITAGDSVTPNGTTGQLQTASPAGGTNCGIYGQAMESAVATQLFSVFLSPSIKQG